jgi:hypothetical protein
MAVATWIEFVLTNRFMHAIAFLAVPALLTPLLLASCQAGSGELLVADDDSVAGDDDSVAGDDDSVLGDDDSTSTSPYEGEYDLYMEDFVDFGWGGGAGARGKGGEGPYCTGEFEAEVDEEGRLAAEGDCEWEWDGGGDPRATFTGEVSADGDIVGTLLIEDGWMNQEFEIVGVADGWTLEIEWEGTAISHGGPNGGDSFDAWGGAWAEIQ